MKSLMIVENEKSIRAGIRAMVANAPVYVETVIECSNGAEAMDVLSSQDIEVMITDIRMPKMDGVELVRRTRELSSPPIVIVISGYSDFDYAVDVFRQGVRDYLLKPIERERIFELLATLDDELEAKNQAIGTQFVISSSIMKSMMLGAMSDNADIGVIGGEYVSLLGGNYAAICVASQNVEDIKDTKDIKDTGELFVFENVGGQTILLAPEDSLNGLKSGILKNKCAGISGVKTGFAELRMAYVEATQARIYAFVWDGIHEFDEIKSVATREEDLVVTAEYIISILCVGKAREAKDLLRQMLFLAQNNRISAEDYLGFLNRLLKGMKRNFSHVSFAAEQLESVSDILGFDTAYAFYVYMGALMDSLAEFLARDLENLNLRKIRLAIDFIEEHFQSGINMDDVRKYVSMNYTHFSSLFKKYMGTPFTKYLKNRRLAESRRLLADLSLSIRQVGEMSGFTNEKHFMKCFKLETGISPGDYRSNLLRNP